MKYLNVVIVALLCAVLALPQMGCKASQSQVNTAVQDIANWTPVIASDASALLSDVGSFEPADAAAIQSFVTTMNADATALTGLCKQYLAAPSPSLLTQIAATVGTLATSDSGALLAVLQIKNANSQMIAKGVLTTIATAVTILSGYLQSVNVATSAPSIKALRQMRRDVDQAQLDAALSQAKRQGLVDRRVTLAQLGF